MKKKLIFSAVIFALVFLMVSCASSTKPEQADSLFFLVANWNAGPAVEGARVNVYESGTDNLIGSGLTNEFGAVEVGIIQVPERIDVEVSKQGLARSLVQGLKAVAAQEIPFSIVIKPALLNSDPNTQTDPVVKLSLFEIAAQGNPSRDAAPIAITDPITGPFTAKVIVTANNHVSAIYEPLLERIAGAGFVTTDRAYAGDTDRAEFNISPTGFDGECALYTTVYDHNDNRTLRVDYLQVVGTNPGEVVMYQPMTFADFSEWMFMGSYSLENIWSYTRRTGVALNNTPREIEEIENTGETLASRMIQNSSIRSLNDGSRFAPAGGNLWSHLYWTDWTTQNLYHGAYPDELPNPGDRPDGYNLYRSLDGQTYEKFGFVTENFGAGLANTILSYVGQGYNENQIMNLFPSYKDPSIFLHPGLEMYYQITSVYGTLESTPTDLGSVVPLDSFNIELETPVPEAVGVSQNPVFKWKTTNALESTEGTVTYNYGLFMYDWVQADTGLIIPTSEGDMLQFTEDTADSVEVTFSGADLNDSGLNWSWYNPYADSIDLYTETMLEPNKTYNWGINIAYALVKDADSRAYSISADFKIRDKGWYYDPVACMEPDLHADFTTGAQ